MARRHPEWIKEKKYSLKSLHPVKSLLRKKGLNTVCESARCPNINECFSKPTATFMILGNICTRSCSFCAVTKGSTAQTVNADEPAAIAEAVIEMGLKHVVITSVTRDDLPDGGSIQFAKTVESIKALPGNRVIEVLTPDFNGNEENIIRVAKSLPNIYNHNVETVSRLYPEIRPEADLKRSLNLLRLVKKEFSAVIVKSGFMVGLGETFSEILELLEDLSKAGCDVVTIGQYLQPSRNNVAVKEYITPELFKKYELEAKKLNFKQVASGPHVRSSFNAELMTGFTNQTT